MIILDPEDSDLLAVSKVYKDGYVRTMYKGKLVVISKVICDRMGKEVKEGEQRLYKDGNRLNNSRTNILIATVKERNIRRKKNKKEGYLGVRKSGKKYIAVIRDSGKDKYLGTFETAEEAAKTYDKESLSLRGELATLNFVSSLWASEDVCTDNSLQTKHE